MVEVLPPMVGPLTSEKPIKVQQGIPRLLLLYTVKNYIAGVILLQRSEQKKTINPLSCSARISH